MRCPVRIARPPRRTRRFLGSIEALEGRALMTVDLTATPGPAGEIDLSWTDSGSGDRYTILRSFDGQNAWVPIATTSPGQMTLQNTGLYDDTLYFYEVQARAAAGVVATSNVATATTASALVDPYPAFADSFDAQAIGPAWSFVGGSWRQAAGSLRQATTVPGDIRKALVTDQAYPADQQITAKVLVSSWADGPAARAGVGVDTSTADGTGYNLVFYDGQHVAFLDDGTGAVGNEYTFAWQPGTWYWFRLEESGGTLYGKVWADGTAEPAGWMFEQDGWTDHPSGAPALNGGGAAPGQGRAMAWFDEASVVADIPEPSPFPIGGDPSVHPADFRVTAFASGLDYPHGMAQLADGSLLVATSDPTAGYFDSTGTLLRFADPDGDGVADGPGQVLYTGLPGTLTDLATAGDLVFVTSSSGQPVISVLREGAAPSDPLTLVGTLDFNFPSPWEHLTYALATRPTPGQPGSYDLFFNVGAQSNVTADSGTVGLGGLISGTLQGSSIYMVTVHDTGAGTPTVTGLTQVARGLRNAAGIALDPATGDLYFEDNGMDDPAYGDEPRSADTLHRIAASQIGQSVPDFGFPHSYVQYRTGDVIGGGAVKPLVAFQPLPDPLVGPSESEGPSDIAFAPASFPAGLNDGLFVGFHGRWDLGGLANEENPLVFYDRATGKYFDFIGNDVPNIGHLDGLLTAGNALFLADLSSTGDLYGNGANGVIYEITTVNAPSTPGPVGRPAATGTAPVVASTAAPDEVGLIAANLALAASSPTPILRAPATAPTPRQAAAVLDQLGEPRGS